MYMKTAERAHTPSELWEKIKLDKSYRIGLEEIEKNLEYWPEFIKHKAKQRFTRIRQMLIKKKRMKLEGR
jgi:protein MAK16